MFVEKGLWYLFLSIKNLPNRSSHSKVKHLQCAECATFNSLCQHRRSWALNGETLRPITIRLLEQYYQKLLGQDSAWTNTCPSPNKHKHLYLLVVGTMSSPIGLLWINEYDLQLCLKHVSNLSFVGTMLVNNSIHTWAFLSSCRGRRVLLICRCNTVSDYLYSFWWTRVLLITTIAHYITIDAYTPCLQNIMRCCVIFEDCKTNTLFEGSKDCLQNTYQAYLLKRLSTDQCWLSCTNFSARRYWKAGNSYALVFQNLIRLPPLIPQPNHGSKHYYCWSQTQAVLYEQASESSYLWSSLEEVDDRWH